jgi:hypothetical protein
MENTTKRLTKAEKRILIIKDVLELIKLGVAKIKTGVYCEIKKGLDKLEEGGQFNTYLKKTVCRVCAKGALFLGHVDKFNNCEVVKDGSYNYAYNIEATIRKKLLDNFSHIQLDMIETAFEKKVMYDYTCLIRGRKLEEKCIDFGCKYRYPKDRLKAILKNMLKNNGLFKP